MGISPFSNKAFTEAIKFSKPEEILGLNRGLEATGLPESAIYNITQEKNYITNLHSFPIVDVVTAGAVRDGVTDDTAAFEKAATQLTNGGVIFVPRGEYVINNWNITKSGIRVVGESLRQNYDSVHGYGAVLKLGSNNTMISIGSLTGDEIVSSAFENLLFHGNGYTGDLLSYKRARGGLIRDCTFHSGKRAIYAERAWHYYVETTNFRHCGYRTSIPAVKFFNGNLDGANCSDWNFINCHFTPCNGDSIEFDSSGLSTTHNRGFYFLFPRNESQVQIPLYSAAGAYPSCFLKGTVDHVHIFGGCLFPEDANEVDGVPTIIPPSIDIIGDFNHIFGTRVYGYSTTVKIVGDSNELYGIYTLNEDAAATHHILLDGNDNRAIGITALGPNLTANRWPISFGTGTANSDINSGKRVIVYGTAAPTGAFAKGSICFNSSPSGNNPMGWMCTVTGDPATWKAMADLIP